MITGGLIRRLEIFLRLLPKTNGDTVLFDRPSYKKIGACFCMELLCPVCLGSPCTAQACRLEDGNVPLGDHHTFRHRLSVMELCCLLEMMQASLCLCEPFTRGTHRSLKRTCHLGSAHIFLCKLRCHFFVVSDKTILCFVPCIGFSVPKEVLS